MQAKRFNKYNSLEFASVTHNTSSRLYSIAPLYIGNSGVESLTSYISRLALAHCVYPGILMERLVKQLIDKQYSSANIHKIYKSTGVLNGTGIMGENLVNVLEKLSLQENLSSLTLANFSEIFPTQKLLHKHKLWCPKCYEDWRSQKQEIYEPLLWKIRAVNVCSTHNLPLQEYCPHCLQKNYHLAWKTRPGYCSKCDLWLGDLLTDEKDPILDWNLWVNQNIEELLIQNSSHNITWTKNTVSQSLMKCAQQKTEGNIAALARQLKMPKNTVWLWCKGKNQPSLEMLLRICHGLNVSLWNFLTAENFPMSEKIQSIDFPPKLKSRAKGKVFDRGRIKNHLEEVLKEDKTPPISMVEVAKNLNLHKRTITRQFPELCQQISAKYTQYMKSQHQDTIKQSCQEVREAVKQLYTEGKYPSQNKVEKLISRPGLLRYKEVKKAFQDERKRFKN